MTISDEFRRELFAQESDDVAIMLLTIDDGESPEPIRLSSDATTRLSTDPLTYGTTSRGDVFLYLPFRFVLPQERADVAPRVELTIDNIERSLVQVVEAFTAPPRLTIEIVMASDPDYVEVLLPGMILSNISFTAETITATLVRNALDTEPFPFGTFTPRYFPGLFAR